MQNNYQPKGKTLWDSWFLKEGDNNHVFYLQTLPTENPNDRHNSKISIGHAISKDLLNWQELPTALESGDNDSWDNLALWTGSSIKKDNEYFIFYTGKNKDQQNVQKIGLATSDNLINWRKHDKNPILEPDSKYYEINFEKNDLGNIGAWRDPFVFWDEKDQIFYMTISARNRKFDATFNGCVALASSNDLLNWTIKEPIFSPNCFDEIETTQVVVHEGTYYLFFSTHESDNQDFSYKNGLYCFYSDRIDGEYKPVNGDGLVIDYQRGIYDVRLIKNYDKFHGIGWLDESEGSKFLGKLSKPFNITIKGDKISFSRISQKDV